MTISTAKTHYLAKEAIHNSWDVTNEPALVISSGDYVVFESRDVSNAQLGPQATVEDLKAMDRSKLYPLVGPIYIEGAEPGDTLAIEVVDLEPGDWGWAAIIPGKGLLQEEFSTPYLRVFDLTAREYTLFREDIKIPQRPFLGTMGVCPEGANKQAIIRPGLFGGNMDTRQLTKGTTLYVPVQVEGALFSCGDGHAAQGDGEVCINGIECPMKGTLRFTLQKGRHIRGPQYMSKEAANFLRYPSGIYGTTGIGPDLLEASKEAIRSMIIYLSEGYDLSPEDAYILSSLCVDLKISEIVDDGQYVVSAVFPLSVIDRK